MTRIFIHLLLLTLLTGQIQSLNAAQSAQLSASFSENERWAIFQADDTVELILTLTGNRSEEDVLRWVVTDYLGQERDQGAIKVPAGDGKWETRIQAQDYGAGYFEVHLELEKSKVTVPREGTRRAGILAYGVLPDLEALPLEHVDDSRFGAQGTNFLLTEDLEGKVGNRNPLMPIYPLLGARWVYLNRHLAWLFPDGPDSFQARLDPEVFLRSSHYDADAGCAILVDMHSLPVWQREVPPGAKTDGNNTQAGQRFPPRDFSEYKDMIAQVVREQVVRRNTLFPNMAHNYYQISWEPDWHWKGSDEDFVAMYKAAYEAVHENDPDGLLLGPNSGVLKTGNKLLRRQFKIGLGNYLDGVLIHTYYISQQGKQELPDDMKEVVEMTREYVGADAKIINTEWGVGWRKTPEEDPNALRAETAEFMRGHLVTLGEGVDATFFFYTADHGKSGKGLLYNLRLETNKFGATKVAPKPVFMAAATATRMLEGTRSLGRIDYLGAGVLGYAFDRDGEYVMCLWSEDGEARDVAVPVGAGTQPIGLDPMGNPESLELEDGVVELSLDSIPVWIRGLDAAILPMGHADGTTIKTLPGEDVRLPEIAGREIRAAAFVAGTWRVEGMHAGVMRVPEDASVGPMLVKLVDAKTEELLQTIVVDVNPVVQMKQLKDVAPGQLEVLLSNARAETSEGGLRLLTGETVVAEKQVELEGGQDLKVAFPVRNLDVSEGLRLSYRDARGALCELSLSSPRKILTAHRAVSALTIDGQLDDWLLEDFQRYENKRFPELAERMDPRVAVRYDDKNLYIAVQLNDVEHRQTESPQGLWHADSIQIALAVDPDNPDRKNWQKLNIGRNSVHGHLNVYRDMGDAFSAGIVSEQDLSRAIVRSGDETVYEISIPWQHVALGLEAAPSRNYMGFGLMINNIDSTADGKKTRRQWIDVLGGMSFSKPEDMGQLEFR
ncbi:sugar-binding protein [Coraliomargarita algicola]|uniref:Sugar-binding protein n=1 Tax=Coraliomargarita algicola TaxID=3092156 RepID=A0ABZ0RG46_9BACT|nr:sugar-binding protein [Coraliomargarita sp. J2-16]WPJ95051.1 sugar-binding protein [Coraliomargarita sp. J2-16]